MARDTFLPYEPIYLNVTVANHSKTSKPLLGYVSTGSWASVFRFAILSDAGEQLMGPDYGTTMFVDYAGGPPHYELKPGESCSVQGDLAYFSGKSDSESPDGANVCIPPGHYSVRVSWNLKLVARGRKFDPDSSNTLQFTVRVPDSTEAKALRIYRDLYWWARPSYSLWKETHVAVKPADLDWVMLSRVESLYGEIVRSCPIIPYILLAKLDLATAVHAWLADGGPQTVGSSFRDSLRTLCKDIGLNYPDSPIAADFISRSVYLRNLDGKQADAEFLAELVKRNPESLVGLVAAKLLQAKSK